MKLGCISAVAAPEDFGVRVIVLPEYSDPAFVRLAAKRNPHAIVAAAIEERGRSRALLLHGGKNQIDYLKVGTDGRTRGTGRAPSSTVRVFGDLAVGVVVCMDVQEATFLNTLTTELNASAARYKLLCIPADMTGDWFSTSELMPVFTGISVALSNHPTNHQWRCKSFISDAERRKRAKQHDTESVFFDLNDLTK
jgi:predicted amidohydrolase